MNPWFSVRKDSVVRPDGKPGEYYVVERAGGVGIVAENEDGEYILVGQTRYPTGEYLYEFCAGIVEDGEDFLEAAQRELREETGYEAGEWTLLGEYLNSPGLMNQGIRVFHAKGVKRGSPSPEGTEDISVKLLSEAELRALEIGSKPSSHFLAVLGLYTCMRKDGRK